MADCVRAGPPLRAVDDGTDVVPPPVMDVKKDLDLEVGLGAVDIGIAV
jgi:hypothetical protein